MSTRFTRTLAAICLLAIAGITACSKEDIKLKKQFDALEVTVPAKNNAFAEYQYEIKQSDWVNFLSQNNVTFDIKKIKEVSLESYTLSLPDDGSLKNFDNYEYGDVFFIRPDTKEEVKVAFFDTKDGFIPAGSTTVAFTSQYAELKDFLDYEKFTVKGRIFAKSNTPEAKIKVALGTNMVIKP